MGNRETALKNLPKAKGRKKGTKNKATVELKKATQKHAQAAIDALVELVDEGEPDTARISAAKELLDRGYGKAPQETKVAVDLKDAPNLLMIFGKEGEEWLQKKIK